ncbi:MAG: tetratricopeptide repeat protein [Candidatus Omnitrophica bacterium]|nr:tetratricopeptide repeat protein [Candidatus Omnitrophota bacterium]
MFGLPLAGSADFLTPNVFAKEKAPLLSKEEFLSSDFSKFFKKQEFNQALNVLDSLLKKHPDDILLLRYRALTLDKLNRRKEAIAVYRKILSENPNHVPTHLFLGLAYARDGKPDKAVEELRWVVENSGSENYRHWAQAQLTRVRQMKKNVIKKVERRPYLVGKTGAYYDSNPLLVPSESGLASRSKKDGVDFPVNLSVGYPVILEKDMRVDALYIGQALLHDRGANQVDFNSQGFALNAKKRAFLGGRAVLFGARYDFKTNWLRSNIFSTVNRLLLSLETSFWKKTKTHVYTRVSYSGYRNDGSIPSISSRDGTRGGLGVVQYFYTAKDFRTYFFVKEEISFADTRGDNFKRGGSLTRLGVHGPLDCLGPVTFDVSTGLDYGTYPDFSSLSPLDLNERRDLRTDVYADLTYHWKPDLATRGFYRYIRSENDNGFYERDRQLAGVEVVFSI